MLLGAIVLSALTVWSFVRAPPMLLPTLLVDHVNHTAVSRHREIALKNTAAKGGGDGGGGSDGGGGDAPGGCPPGWVASPIDDDYECIQVLESQDAHGECVQVCSAREGKPHAGPLACIESEFEGEFLRDLMLQLDSGSWRLTTCELPNSPAVRDVAAPSGAAMPPPAFSVQYFAPPLILSVSLTFIAGVLHAP